MLTFNIATEATIVVFAFGLAATAETGGLHIGRDEALMLWCCAFGMLGGLCSIRFNPPVPEVRPGEAQEKQLARLRNQGLLQIIVNMILSAAVSPWACDGISWVSKGSIPVGIKLAFPVAVIIGIGADQIIARTYPKLQKLTENWLVGWAEWWAGRRSAPVRRRRNNRQGD